MDNTAVFIAGLIGLGAGSIITMILMRARNLSHQAELRIENMELKKACEADRERIDWLKKVEEKFREAFESLASKALKENSSLFMNQSKEQLQAMHSLIKGDWNTHRQEFKNIVNPIEKDLDKLDKQVRSMEEKREGAYKSLETHILSLGRAHELLNTTTAQLTQALKSSSVRAKWGEVQLKRIAEMAGLMEHVDFNEQTTSESGEGRPDMIVRLPNKGILPIDAKAPMSSYLESCEAVREDVRNLKLLDHAKAMRGHVKSLAQKAYWSQFETSPEFVVMLVPYESGLSAAFIADPALLEDALDNRVIIVSPATLLALLKVVALGWMQLQIARNAQEIAAQGKELLSRIKVFGAHFGEVGSRLNASVQSYNKAVGSLESRVLPAAKKLKELGAGSDDVESSPQIEVQARALSDTQDE